jgi:hypothetical protein
MPPKSSWILHIPRTVEQLEVMPIPVVDRRVLEHLFGVRRRRAIQLMQHFGGYQSGNTVLVDRIDLVTRLKNMERTAEYAWESQRKQKLYSKLDQLHRCKAATQVRLPVSKQAQHNMLDDLPLGMTLGPGQLIVEFTTPEELFAKLYELAQAAANDFDRVCNIASAQTTMSKLGAKTIP